MSFTFIYESENKKLKSFEKRDDLVLKEVRFPKNSPKSNSERLEWTTSIFQLSSFRFQTQK